MEAVKRATDAAFLWALTLAYAKRMVQQRGDRPTVRNIRAVWSEARTTAKESMS
jgi:hypothetical protein